MFDCDLKCLTWYGPIHHSNLISYHSLPSSLSPATRSLLAVPQIPEHMPFLSSGTLFPVIITWLLLLIIQVSDHMSYLQRGLF